MNRLQSELQRLFLTDGAPPSFFDGQERVRAAVLELARPADWSALSAVWRGVQSELGLPAPAIAVSGSEGLQLWFSFGEPVPVARAQSFLDGLRRRYLPGIAASRLRLLPTSPAAHAALVPGLQAHTGYWSAFIAADLAPVFDETPWLDVPPGEDGQADLLQGLSSIKPASLDSALQALGASGTAPQQASPDGLLDPRRFLLQVMNDESVALALRIDAAKALLPYVGER